MVFILSFIPNIFEFIVLLGLVFFTIFFVPIFQRYILQMESFMIFPFVCVKCCSFWMNLILNIILAYIWNWHFVIWGLITASTLAYMHIYSANHQ